MTLRNKKSKKCSRQAEHPMDRQTDGQSGVKSRVHMTTKGRRGGVWVKHKGEEKEEKKYTSVRLKVKDEEEDEKKCRWGRKEERTSYPKIHDMKNICHRASCLAPNEWELKFMYHINIIGCHIRSIECLNFPNKKIKTLFLSNISKNQRLTKTFFPIIIKNFNTNFS